MEHRRVLVIDQFDHIEAMIKGGLLYYPVEISFSTGKEDALEQILREPPDLIISGLIFQDGTAVDLIQELNVAMTYIPPGIYLAEPNQEQIQNEILKLGAVDVITRPFEMSVLYKKIDHAVSVMKTYNVKSRLENIAQRSERSEEFQLLLEESRSLGIPIAELIKLKQLSTN